ncbi:flagellar filament capping protein FliD [Clostridium formicaceticum]|uniref:Flagellar hook-associated protein 2 n=1 Tax=Clostridium formicaceticum TaxID=1497 RepID=A0AAC9RKM9_9CLOT|nr:flagellar filament capping protein FliD [Clostridium formicaceticum]AOY75695.1 hypothetical protein BJL90_07185 [Clostridium formicaceticum]ARE86015.1 Flagellar hook-associated protein 2 [Clostridium formicaceticum]
MRIGGIASGMDTEQMVQSLMKAERLRIDRFFQQEQRLKWRQEAYNNINRSMANFILDSRKAFGLTTVSNTGTMLNRSAESFNWVKKATSNDESIVKATANANAMAGTHKIEVKQLADVASATSKNLKEENFDGKMLVDGEGKFNFNKRELILSTGAAEGRSIKVEIGSDTNIKTMDDFVKFLNTATSKEEGKEDVSLGMRAAYDKSLGRLMLTTKETGDNQYIKIKDTTGDNLNFAEVAFDAEQIDGEGNLKIKGEDAKILFNGQEVKKSTNNFSIFGINLQLQAEQAENAEPITIRVEADTDSIFDKVKSFVDEYNKIIDMINGQLGEKYYRDFAPLTDEQKEAMSEKDIELWEEKAKSGLLRNDSTLTRTLQTMRSNLYERVENVTGSYNNITQLGITTGAYQDGGKLVIDEQKLRNAINDDPEGVVNLLFKTPDASITNDKEKMKNTGLVQRIYDGMTDGIKEVIRQSGPGEDAALLRNVRSNILIDFVTAGSQSVLDKDLSNINSRIAREEMLLAKREDRYWQQFTAMEKALSQMNQQSAWLMSQLGQQY